MEQKTRKIGVSKGVVAIGVALLIVTAFVFALPTLGPGSTGVAVGQGTYCADCGNVKLDIMPGVSPNTIDLQSEGVVAVAVLAQADCDCCFDPEAVTFAGASPVSWTAEDVNNDGKLDCLFYFNIQDLTELNENSTQATLSGKCCPTTPEESPATCYLSDFVTIIK